MEGGEWRAKGGGRRTEGRGRRAGYCRSSTMLSTVLFAEVEDWDEGDVGACDRTGIGDGDEVGERGRE